jgi:ABC-type transport system involved in cytochrome c biogenesis permease subunit
LDCCTIIFSRFSISLKKKKFDYQGSMRYRNLKDEILVVTVSILMLCLGFSPIYAKNHEKTQGISVEKLGKIIVLENGRKKPLDTYARNKLMQFSGRQKVSGISALEWISRLIFDPESADDDLVFLINNPDVVNAVGIPPRTKRRYCFRELYSSIDRIDDIVQKNLQTSSSEWTSFEKEIIQTRNNIQEYLSLRSTFSFLEPQNYLAITDSILAEQVGLSLRFSPSYLDLLSSSRKIAEGMREIQKKGMDSLSSNESALLDLTRRMFEIEKDMKTNPPYIVPVGTSPEEWLSLWGTIGKLRTGSLDDPSVTLMVKIREAYLNSNQSVFNDAIDKFIQHTYTPVAKSLAISDPELEILYNRVNPFFYSKIIYGLAFLISLFAVASLWKRAFSIGLILILSGMVLHTSGIIARMVIMHHPPVTNLYETFVFTAWASVGLGIVLELIRIRSFGILLSALTGFLFLHVAGRYTKDGDTLGMLTAVLDSSFWLTTHIVTISLGYAGFVGAGLMAHVYLLMRMIKMDRSDSDREKLLNAISGMFVFGFIFTTVGTVFGGMWADQAWGRFWGWDPKENGALLIILCGIAILHCKIGRLTGKYGIVIGSIVGMMLVMMTWIGVNLLGIGLHSYGFTSVGVHYLLSYLAFEILFLIASALLIRRAEKKTVSVSS